ncbi:hypothetical protein NPX13_g2088 [Xylaria arbuscula]|uniref:Uncharacterized protein n=1 Tax=Xylaria arbuscula TaxID=114810 RepID=A0A9W8TQQ8_9PEZI|nr:hypothetical protein NPX13_g2088 [Xylaria arbuscula]
MDLSDVESTIDAIALNSTTRLESPTTATTGSPSISSVDPSTSEDLESSKEAEYSMTTPASEYFRNRANYYC